jgi:hypothetical protein
MIKSWRGLLFFTVCFFLAAQQILSSENPDNITDSDQIVSLTQALAGNQQALDHLYSLYASQADAPESKTSWLTTSMRDGNADVRRLVREGENIQQRLSKFIAANPVESSLKTVASTAPTDGEGEETNDPRKQRYEEIRREIIVLDDELRGLDTSGEPTAKSAELRQKRQSLLDELLTVLQSNQDLNGSIQP